MTFIKPKNIVLFGSSGSIGSAFKSEISSRYSAARVHSFSRSYDGLVDYCDEEHLKQLAQNVAKESAIDLIIVAIGMLHDGDILPEKSLKDLSQNKFEEIYRANVIAPALVAKHFLPYLNKDKPTYFAALSARVGSISDNRLGGWYAYRASKAALNMVIKNASIEMKRTHPQSIIVGLHPGTVDSSLSKPFQKNVPEGKLFTPLFSVQQMLNVLENLTFNHSGKCFAWDGEEILP